MRIEVLGGFYLGFWGGLDRRMEDPVWCFFGGILAVGFSGTLIMVGFCGCFLEDGEEYVMMYSCCKMLPCWWCMLSA